MEKWSFGNNQWGKMIDRKKEFFIYKKKKKKVGVFREGEVENPKGMNL